MPTILRKDGFQFGIYYNDHDPPHVHVKKAENDARVRIDQIEILSNVGFNPREIKHILQIVQEHQQLLLSRWYEIYPLSDEE